LLGIVVISQEARLGAGLVPGIRALGLEGVEDAGVDRGIAQEEVRVAGAAPFFTKHVSGTPQARWRDRTQSGRVSIIERRRFWPETGVNLTSSLIEASARSRIVLPCASLPSFRSTSMAANHCGRFRRMTGALERQECASEIVMRLRASSLPTSTSLSITTLLAFPGLPFSRMIRSPPKKGRSGRNDESSRMLYVISRPCLRPIS
jgi:hypothetical protein